MSDEFARGFVMGLIVTCLIVIACSLSGIALTDKSEREKRIELPDCKIQKQGGKE